jgi:murein L,D-transpeptidase YafK
VGAVLLNTRNDGKPAGANETPAAREPVPLPTLKKPELLVEKYARRLTVFDDGEAIKSYGIALGWGKGDKVREGDGCTPEGRFYICHHNPGSRYHLSMGLSYPNIEDAERGLRNGLISKPEYGRIVEAIRKKRTPPWNTPLGGEIMIHGHGTKRDWTAGCIALANEDIEELYHALPDGTPVEIVP